MKLRIIPTSEGYFDVLTNQYIYNYTDHLGNVRLSYSDSNKDGLIQPRQYQSLICNFSPAGNICYQGWKPGEIVEVNNYYPFGLMHNYTATTQNPYQLKYNGKELKETGMYDYGARFYMPDIGRWGVVDPMAEDMRRHSPYNYAFNNPINFVDPDGMKPGQIGVFNRTGHWDFDPNSTIMGSDFFGGSQYSPAMYVTNSFAMSFMYDGSGRNSGGNSPLHLGITGAFAQAAFDLLKQSVDGQLKLTFENGIVSGSAVEGATLSEAANWLLEAINNPDIKVTLETIEGFYFYDTFTKKDTRIEGDGFRGSYERNGKLFAKNYLSTDVSSVIDKLAGSPIGTTPLHAVLEAYIGAKYFPDSYKEAPFNNNIKYLVSHDWAACIDKNYKDLPPNFRFNPGLEVVNGKIRSYTPFYYDVNTKEVIHQFKTYKYSK